MSKEIELSTRGTTMDSFFLHAHIDLSLRLTRGNMHSLTEGYTNINPWMGWPDDSPSGCSLS
jgi:hypothetical protein